MTTMGPVTLIVGDRQRQVAFYRERIGLRVLSEDASSVHLGVEGGDLLVLEERKDAVRAVGTTGLFHVAILLPSRAALARALARLAETKTPLHGAADHRVSESLYLADPEGNGLELYRDRPRESWVWHDGLVTMTTDPLDVDGLLAEGEAQGTPWRGLPDGTRVGHVHLRVAHIAPAERFYCDLIGFDLTTRYGDGASFVATGGYHHHVAFNTWAGVGVPPPPANARGLKEFVVNLGQAGEVGRAVLRLRAAGLEVADGNLVRDPSGNPVRLVAR
jgi:catechol 2,3-dioxygenase